MAALSPRTKEGLFGLVALAAMLVAAVFVGRALEASHGRPSVFDLPAISAGERLAMAEVRAGNIAAAEGLLRGLLRRYPLAADLHADLAGVLLLRQREDEAYESLEAAVRAGLPATRLNEDEMLAPLRGQQRFDDLVARAAPSAVRFAAVTPVRDGVALVSDANTTWNPQERAYRVRFSFPEPGRSAPVDRSDPVAAALNAWFAEGTAAGNVGDLYDNRDRGHSALSAAYRQIARVTYDEAARATGVDSGLNGLFLFNAPTIGNASLAETMGPHWRSLPRRALVTQAGAERLFREYAANAIYVYPAHRDFGAEVGDVIIANTPYVLISRGSSGSDQPLVEAVASILAAFRPEVKSYLVERGLIAPTVQWIFRHAGRSDQEYLTGAAHPSVFDGTALDVMAMVRLAHDLTTDDVPPMVLFAVREESHGIPGVTVFAPMADETVFDTPSAVTRAIQATDREKRMVIDARATTDPNGRPLTFHWVVLNGDPDRVAIRPLDENGGVAEIVVASPESGAGGRIDIGVFADNGRRLSAPAFVSLLYSGEEQRTYRDDGRIAEIDYAAHPDRYVDPLVFPLRPWRDTYAYDDAGRLTGWTRTRADGETRYTAEGARIVESDAEGRPTATEAVRYTTQPRRDGRFEVIEEAIAAEPAPQPRP